ncbi:GNAT family N-acetyltransferase [Streptomyces acidiscabies]|uniref:GNAT family N-acetyltransferase n=4 Tax=Streptomyces acidiscabies TaxID=42234 RepID=A0AAP6B8F6_9ACTN|nr:GNAT family N-acetyltransferase [Streptomyces acidiscabies]MBZ3915682.1 GNAT family N-acetyltransferase [Streptomyces acidiscabies]MDX2960086.1 GNAT family N-acetyltransferase [Streptomyces acidiscabies]MDX3019437.1 GNAT family N-acetyltransferase [Streptomyces acidiscabies]MDX3793164.1 GNAT family N-acetyltransferase [Streptomyces acidiscabies]GAQ52882.1 acetyltransferase Pat [Streptomyces acidiscabies]
MQSAQERHEYPAHWEADVVLRDGGTARVRPITADDAERLVSFYEQVSDESKYYRFFAPYPRLSAKDVHRFTHHDFVDRVGLAATVGGEFIATVRYDRIGPDGLPAKGPADEAEVAFLVQDAHQGRGVASALLEHIGAVARERGIRRFAAEVLPANSKMIKVFTDAGYTQKRSFEDGVVRLEFGLEPTERSLAVQRAREQRAEARSVRRLLAPGSVAVVGAGRAPGGVGHAVLANLRAAGFTGTLHAVNKALPDGVEELDGVPAHRSVRDIEGPVDLAVVAVPADAVPEVVAECGEHGVQGLVVVSAGYAESGPDGRERQRELVRLARAYGMRIVGPNAFGIINTAPDVRLNASLAPETPRPGRIGLFAQSGAIGVALLSRLHRRGGGVTGVTGVSTFVSSGNRADVSGNDVLQYWYDDPDTDVVLMYLESIGNPRKFTRLARRTAAAKPLVVVQGAGSAPQGHAVRATRLPHATVSALLRQAGVIRVATITELVDTGLLLARQPLPAGPRVAILGNSESLGLLTYDACLSEGLRPLPPLDLTTGASADDFRHALTRALADDTCDAVVVTAIPAIGEGSADDAGLAEALRSAAAEVPAKPVLVVHVELGGLAEALSAAMSTAPQADAGRAAGATTAPGSGTTARARTGEALGSSPAPTSVPDAPPAHPRVSVTVPPPPAPPGQAPAPRAGNAFAAARTPHPALAAPPDKAAQDPLAPSGGPRLIPAYPAAERAVRALAEAVKYAQWRREAADPGKVPEYEDIDEKGAVRMIDGLLARGQGLTLGTEETCELLGRYGIGVRRAMPAPTPEDAVRAARALGYPVALKATAPHLRHRADLGGVRLDLTDEEQLRRSYGELTELFGTPQELRPVVQAMAPRGVDTVVRAVIDPAAGAVLSFGLAGAASQLLGDMAHRLVPVTDRDATSLVRSIRTAPLLFGWRGSTPVDTPALEELLQRVSRLVDDHPEVVAVTLEPVVVAPHGVSVLGASVRLAPPPARDDLGPRTLPAY